MWVYWETICVSEAEEPAPLNIGATAVFDVGFSFGIGNIELVLDDNPEQISWEILEDEELIASGDNYFIENSDYQYEILFNPSSCYTLIVNDQFSDGLAGSESALA